MEELPPVGVMPEWRHRERRAVELTQAIGRYIHHGTTERCVYEWWIELGDHIEWLQRHKEKKAKT